MYLPFVVVVVDISEIFKAECNYLGELVCAYQEKTLGLKWVDMLLKLYGCCFSVVHSAQP